MTTAKKAPKKASNQVRPAVDQAELKKLVTKYNTAAKFTAGRVVQAYGSALADENGTVLHATAIEHSREIGAIAEAVKAGDMAPLEEMLVGQAIALQSMFTDMAERGKAATHIEQWKMFMNAAMKAQAQSRATIDSVVNLKFPKQVQFVKQTNIAQGHQQVNNAPPIESRAQAENANQQTELLEHQHNGEWMDTGAQAKAARSDTAMEAVETVNRPRN